MTILMVPTSDVAFFDQVTELDGTDYRLTFNYNQREGCYYLSIGSPESKEDVLSGIKIVSNYGLVRRWNGRAGLPPGDLVAITTAGASDAPADLGELGEGKRVELHYFTASEFT
jgi:hypothetical protein